MVLLTSCLFTFLATKDNYITVGALNFGIFCYFLHTEITAFALNPAKFNLSIFIHFPKNIRSTYLQFRIKSRNHRSLSVKHIALCKILVSSQSTNRLFILYIKLGKFNTGLFRREVFIKRGLAFLLLHSIINLVIE